VAFGIFAMKLIEKMIANRINVAFLLLLLLMASYTPLVFLNGILKILFPLFVGVSLIFWLIYSSIGKKKLVIDGLISKSHSDMVYFIYIFYLLFRLLIL
jgi:hypothetical protein